VPTIIFAVTASTQSPDPGHVFEQAKDSALIHVAEHTRRYIESEGVDGHLWRGIATLVLVSRGRRTGQWRRNALIYGRYGPAYVVVGSRGGHRNHPLWYLNLVENPRAMVQVGANRLDVMARTADPGERALLWRVMTGIFPTYDEYQTRTERTIPVVLLTPAGKDTTG
jgi:deazaflavin-dependent oxidoreductase (nitroreductase family)